MLGVVAGSQELIDAVWGYHLMHGAVASPYDAWNGLRGIRTLTVRLARQADTALRLATFLEEHPAVAGVRYPGLDSPSPARRGQAPDDEWRHDAHLRARRRARRRPPVRRGGRGRPGGAVAGRARDARDPSADDDRGHAPARGAGGHGHRRRDDPRRRSGSNTSTTSSPTSTGPSGDRSAVERRVQRATEWAGVSLDYVVCDVFTDRPLTGNQLAVFTDASDIDDSLLQALAREIKFSETVFVYPPDDAALADATIRIFTPAVELPFAGHPVLGTAVVMGRRLGSRRGPAGHRCRRGPGDPRAGVRADGPARADRRGRRGRTPR